MTIHLCPVDRAMHWLTDPPSIWINPTQRSNPQNRRRRDLILPLPPFFRCWSSPHLLLREWRYATMYIIYPIFSSIKYVKSSSGWSTQSCFYVTRRWFRDWSRRRATYLGLAGYSERGNLEWERGGCNYGSQSPDRLRDWLSPSVQGLLQHSSSLGLCLGYDQTRWEFPLFSYHQNQYPCLMRGNILSYPLLEALGRRNGSVPARLWPGEHNAAIRKR